MKKRKKGERAREDEGKMEITKVKYEELRKRDYE